MRGEVDATNQLWLSVGDANLPAGENRAQDPDRLNGKVLRLNLDGSVPADNPFDSPVYSLGHRNPQGLAFGPDGTAWEVEHGTDENDEINHLQAAATTAIRASPAPTRPADPRRVRRGL